MDRLVLIFIAIFAWTSTVTGQNQLTPNNNDPIEPLITFLSQLQILRNLYTTARQSPNSLAPTSSSPTARPFSVLQFLQTTTSSPIAFNNLNSITNTDKDNIINDSRSRNNNNNNNINDESGGTSLSIRLPSFRFPSFRLLRQPSNDVQRVNQGVTDILEGVRMASLERILRGSFSFTRNENVRSIADNVLNSIFPTSTRRSNTGVTQNNIN